MLRGNGSFKGIYGRKLLQEPFGHPYTIAVKFVGEITEGPQIKPSDRSGLLEFADRLKNCEHTLESMGFHFIFVPSSLKWRTLFNNLIGDQA